MLESTEKSIKYVQDRPNDFKNQELKNFKNRLADSQVQIEKMRSMIQELTETIDIQNATFKMYDIPPILSNTNTSQVGS